MTALAQLAGDITFFEFGMSLLALGAIERILFSLPEDIVGPGGWLLDTGEAE